MKKILMGAILLGALITPAYAQQGFTVILHVHCKDSRDGSDRAPFDLKVTSQYSCDDARAEAMQQNNETDLCRFGNGTDDPTRVTTGETEWISTNTCREKSFYLTK